MKRKRCKKKKRKNKRETGRERKREAYTHTEIYYRIIIENDVQEDACDAIIRKVCFYMKTSEAPKKRERASSVQYEYARIYKQSTVLLGGWWKRERDRKRKRLRRDTGKRLNWKMYNIIYTGWMSSSPYIHTHTHTHTICRLLLCMETVCYDTSLYCSRFHFRIYAKKRKKTFFFSSFSPVLNAV